jgi:hypothetical protein
MRQRAIWGGVVDEAIASLDKLLRIHIVSALPSRLRLSDEQSAPPALRRAEYTGAAYFSTSGPKSALPIQALVL